MSRWICSECDYVFEAEVPPETCPSCRSRCVYSDVTCYIPECGGPGHLDTKLVALKAKEAKKHIKQAAQELPDGLASREDNVD